MSISKLNGPITSSVLNTADKVATEKGKPTPQDIRGTGESAIKLSPLSEQLKTLSKDYATTAAFDEKRVETLKTALANGTFRINADTVADKMIAEARQLAPTKQN
jgi:negative regulator of flagellin synthesis FlgM